MVLTPSYMVALGSRAPRFSLPDTDGTTVSLDDFRGMPLLVMFICNHCPYVQHIRDTLAQVTRDIQDQGVAVVGINSNDPDKYPDDSPEMMKAERSAVGYEFPYLFDATQMVARAFHATCTPDFFLYDRNHRLVYRGQFDASRPGNGVPVTGENLLEAVEHVLNDDDPVASQQPSVGCNIKWK